MSMTHGISRHQTLFGDTKLTQIRAKRMDFAVGTEKSANLSGNVFDI
jgi:hypothetical protein